MKKADLVALGLEDEELIKQIIILHGKDIEEIKKTNVDLTDQLGSLQTKLTEAGTTIESFKTLDIDSIKAAAEGWKTKAEQAEAEALKKVSAMKFDHALEKALTGAKARNLTAVKSLLDLESVKIAEDGSLEGLEDQLEAVRKDNDFLFESETPLPRVVAGANNKSVNTDSAVLAARKAAGLGSHMEE